MPTEHFCMPISCSGKWGVLLELRAPRWRREGKMQELEVRCPTQRHSLPPPAVSNSWGQPHFLLPFSLWGYGFQVPHSPTPPPPTPAPKMFLLINPCVYGNLLSTTSQTRWLSLLALRWPSWLPSWPCPKLTFLNMTLGTLPASLHLGFRLQFLHTPHSCRPTAPSPAPKGLA